MNEIDWSKAPEGAQYYCYHNDLFYKFDAAGHGVCTRLGGSWFSCADKDDYEPGELTPLPSSPKWNGEGLPPVGVRCEAAIPHTSGTDNDRSFIWIEGSVIAYYEIKGKTYAWFAEDDGFYPPNVLEFRPIRTPEQIAAEEREKAVDALCYEIITHYGYPKNAESYRALATKLHDAGYRKTEG